MYGGVDSRHRVLCRQQRVICLIRLWESGNGYWLNGYKVYYYYHDYVEYCR